MGVPPSDSRTLNLGREQSVPAREACSMRFRQLLALAVAAFLTWSSVPARPTVLGVVVEADRAHLNSTAVT